MKLLHKFLINVIYGIKKVMHFIFAKRDYTIDDIYIEYFVDHSKDFSTETMDHPLWVNQSCEIEPTVKSYVIDEKDLVCVGLSIGDPIPTPPEAVTKILIRISYWYGNRMYKFLTYNNEYTWPPKKSTTMSFHIPLTSAQLLDCDDKPVKDVLDKIRRYAGPNSDFYGEKVMIKDMLFYSEDRLKNELPRIKLKNCFGMMKTVDTLTGLISDLRLP
jgi:hypothetical protein